MLYLRNSEQRDFVEYFSYNISKNLTVYIVVWYTEAKFDKRSQYERTRDNRLDIRFYEA